MKTKEVDIGDKKYVIKKLSVKDAFRLMEAKNDEAKSFEVLLKVGVSDPKLDDKALEEMELKDGMKLAIEIQNFNELTEDFLSQIGAKPSGE